MTAWSDPEPGHEHVENGRGCSSVGPPSTSIAPSSTRTTGSTTASRITLAMRAPSGATSVEPSA